MTTSINDILNMKKEYMKKIKKDGQEVVKNLLKDFFKDNTLVKSVKWTQYTPYFMDGDPCVFSVNEASLKVDDITYLRNNLKDYCLAKSSYEYDRFAGKRIQTPKVTLTDAELLGESGERGDGFISGWDLEDGASLKKPLIELNNILQQADDILEVVFGDHVEVTVHPDRIETEECEHD